MVALELQTVFRKPAFGAEQATPGYGVYMDEQVVLELDPASQIEDLAEEIGMAITYRGDRRVLENRKLRSLGNLHERIIKQISGYRRALPEIPGPAAIQRLLERIVALETGLEPEGGDADAANALRDAILQELEAFDLDPTHQFVALKLILQQLEGHPVDRRLRSALTDVLAVFDETARKRDVRAGFAAALPASRHGEAIGGTPAEVRAVYRKMVAKAYNMAELFQLLCQFNLKRRFARVLGVFARAAARDLASTGPSTDRDYIRALISELDRLRKARSIIQMSAELLELTNRHLDPEAQIEGKELDLSADILAFACKERPGYSDARELMRLHEASPMSVRVLFANGLRELHGELPITVYPSSKAYLAQRTAILRMLEIVVEEEEFDFHRAQEGTI